MGKSFAPGQVYVALSRCTSFDGVVLKSPVGYNAIKIDAHVLDHIKNNADQPELLYPYEEIRK
ncbi:MAG: hypothetical protein LBG96_16585 [Tannerella sp.]|nr:hypothetical protein [Tannerella sp.]